MTADQHAATVRALAENIRDLIGAVEDDIGEPMPADIDALNEVRASLDALVALAAAERDRADRAEEVLVWAETFLARHDAFLQQQTPLAAYAMKDAADGFRAALAASQPAEPGAGEQ